MQDDVNPDAGVGSGCGIAEINLAKVDFSRQFFNIGLQAGGEVVQATHGMALRNKRMREVRADKAGDTGNEVGSQVSI